MSMTDTGASETGPETRAAPADKKPTIGSLRLTGLVILGGVCWAAAVGVIQFGGIMGAFDGTWATAILFLVTALAAHAVLWACMRVVEMHDEEALTVGSVISAVALLLHGVALTWFPQAYGPDPEVVRLGSAWLLWGVGATLLMAWLRQRSA